MSEILDNPDPFLSQVIGSVESNMANEQFGVSELAEALHMSRSNLLRRIKKSSKLSVSQLIRQVRLRKGMQLLQNTDLNVSEVSLQVGFGSASYFIKCFREHYGYPPGEVGERTEEALPLEPVKPRLSRPVFIGGLVGLVTVAVLLVLVFFNPMSPTASVEKSIAVLPFKNDSNDSTNLYLINGLMESTLNKLQQIKDLKVISRTSVERYRNSTKSIPEMAEELNVNYVIEGSGQKIGDAILLNVQLIDARTDKHLWSKQYRENGKEIFELQEEVARNIIEEIEAIITPEEAERMEFRPTQDMVAYDYFLQGQDLLTNGTTEEILKSVSFFKKAIERDKTFALAYAEQAMAYYNLDMYQAEKKYLAEMNYCADKALFYDPKLAPGLVAKGMTFLIKKEYEEAIPYLEKAIEYNPNSNLAINLLADFYCNRMPNTRKYLEYALMGVRIDAMASDSITAGYNYLHLANALVQTGFREEALFYINKSLDYHPNNPFSSYLKIFIKFTLDHDIVQTKKSLINQLANDTTRLDIVQEIGKLCHMMRNNEEALIYYNRFLYLKELYKIDVYQHEYLRVAAVFAASGDKKRELEFLEIYKAYAEADQTIYKDLYFFGYYCYLGELDKSLDYLEKFTKQEDYQYWILLLDEDPMSDPLLNHPRFRSLVNKIEQKFWAAHDEIKRELEDKDLL